MMSPRRRIASISIPVRVEPTLTEAQTYSVVLSAMGIARIRFSSAGVIPFDTTAEKPPRKLTPTSFAAWSSVLAIFAKSSGQVQADAPIRPMGVTKIRLFTIGIPYSFAMSSPTLTRSFAFVVIFV